MTSDWSDFQHLVSPKTRDTRLLSRSLHTPQAWCLTRPLPLACQSILTSALCKSASTLLNAYINKLIVIGISLLYINSFSYLNTRSITITRFLTSCFPSAQRSSMVVNIILYIYVTTKLHNLQVAQSPGVSVLYCFASHKIQNDTDNNSFTKRIVATGSLIRLYLPILL